MFYSATTGGFYLDDHADLPSDAVKITAARHAALMNAEARGDRIEADARGRPVTRRRTLSVAQRRAGAVTAIKAETARRIELACPLWRQLNLLREGRADEVAALVDPLRAVGNAIEARITRMTGADLDAFDPFAPDLWPG